jgi:hypothetical protein
VNESGKAKKILFWGLATFIVAAILPLASLALDSNRSFNLTLYTTSLLNLAQGLLIVGAVFSFLKELGFARTLVPLCLGAILNFSQLTEPEVLANPWKYYLAWPLTLLALTLFSKLAYPANIAPFAIAATISATFESRNSLGVATFCFLLCLLVGSKQALARLSPRKLGAILAASGVCILAAVPFFLAWVTSGGLGQDLQSRQLEQLEIGFLGSRIESTVGFGLMAHSPLGIGSGVEPSQSDRQSGIDAFALLLNPTSNSLRYVESRVLGESVHLHSILFDFWAISSFVGLFFGVLVLHTIGKNLLRVSSTGVIAPIAFLYVQAFWDLLFSPILVNLKYASIALAVALWQISISEEKDSVV